MLWRLFGLILQGVLPCSVINCDMEVCVSLMGNLSSLNLSQLFDFAIILEYMFSGFIWPFTLTDVCPLPIFIIPLLHYLLTIYLFSTSYIVLIFCHGVLEWQHVSFQEFVPHCLLVDLTARPVWNWRLELHMADLNNCFCFWVLLFSLTHAEL